MSVCVGLSRELTRRLTPGWRFTLAAPEGVLPGERPSLKEHCRAKTVETFLKRMDVYELEAKKPGAAPEHLRKGFDPAPRHDRAPAQNQRAPTGGLHPLAQAETRPTINPVPPLRWGCPLGAVPRCAPNPPRCVRGCSMLPVP